MQQHRQGDGIGRRRWKQDEGGGIREQRGVGGSRRRRGSRTAASVSGEQDEGRGGVGDGEARRRLRRGLEVAGRLRRGLEVAA